VREEELARAAGVAIRAGMIERKRVWAIGFASLCMAPVAMLVEAPWLTMAIFTLSIAAVLRVQLIDGRMNQARATLAWLAIPSSTHRGQAGEGE
jgi:hypothetical protein